MPFYVRKSVSAGPFRFNLSKSGVGLSVGVKGLRIGTGPRGHYIQAGRGGLYYRASIGGGRSQRPMHQKQQPIPVPRADQPISPVDGGQVVMVEVASADVLQMQDSSVSELVDDLNAKQARIPLGRLLGIGVACLGLLTIMASGSLGQNGPAIGIIVLLLALPAWAIGGWLDQSLRRSVLFYNLDSEAETKFERATKEYDALVACRGRWHIEAGGAVHDLTTWKRNAGADHLVNRKAARLGYSLPKVLRSNITPPALGLGRRTFYFFPEVVLVQDGKKFGAVGYGDLQIRHQPSRFIESGSPPNDAQVVDHTWEHPNKSGGPDRRFKSNRRLPVCLYDAMHLSSRSGVNELAQFSRVGIVERFAASLRELPKSPASASLLALSSPSSST